MVRRFDLGPAVEHLPWPTVRGKRCLDVGPPGGPIAAEMERRGAAEVVAAALDGLDPAVVGTFDVVVAHSALAGLVDPVGALRAIRSVSRRVVVSAEPVDPALTIIGRGRALFTLEPGGGFGFNAAGHRRLLDEAGFEVERALKPYVVPSADPEAAPEPGRLGALAARALTGSAAPGTVHRALIARPRTGHGAEGPAVAGAAADHVR